MFHRMFRGMRFVGVAFAAAVTAEAALAGGSDFVTVRSVAVPYGDLNLGTPAGQEVLRARIDSAALKACGPKPVFNVNYRLAPHFITADYAKCRNAAAVEATVALNNRGIQLAAAY